MNDKIIADSVSEYSNKDIHFLNSNAKIYSLSKI